MSLETELLAVLKTVCPRVFPDVAPVSTTKPFVTYQQVGGEALTYLERATPDKVNALMQINVYAATRTEANNTARQIEQALTAATTLNAKPDGALVALYEEDTEIRGARQDFSIWAQR
jgi:hypothetical protein